MTKSGPVFASTAPSCLFPHMPLPSASGHRRLLFLEEALKNVYGKRKNDRCILFNPDFCQGLQIPKLNGHRFFRHNGSRFRQLCRTPLAGWLNDYVWHIREWILDVGCQVLRESRLGQSTNSETVPHFSVNRKDLRLAPSPSDQKR
jgi:hypothetical protein